MGAAAGALHPFWQGADANYLTAHKRVYSARGAAAARRCQHCGRDASQWAYDHLDPSVSLTPQGYQYSVDVSHYIPLCIPCHRVFDREGQPDHG